MKWEAEAVGDGGVERPQDGRFLEDEVKREAKLISCAWTSEKRGSTYVHWIVVVLCKVPLSREVWDLMRERIETRLGMQPGKSCDQQYVPPDSERGAVAFLELEMERAAPSKSVVTGNWRDLRRMQVRHFRKKQPICLAKQDRESREAVRKQKRRDSVLMDDVQECIPSTT